ncbi:MAG: winged helix-turn-helix transcriptional regulator [Promethearchaeota archaeon]
MIENHEIYFDKSIPHGNIKKLYFQNKEISKKILNCLKNDEIGINQSRLSEKLKIHPKTIKKYLDILEEIGLIMKKKISKKEILYFLK